jgi:hypothetical protein
MHKLQPNLDPTLYKIDGADTHSDVRSYKQEVSTEQLLKEFNAFERIDLKNSVHKQELQQMFPSWLIEDTTQTDLELLCKIGRYDKNKRTFVVGIFENRGLETVLISYKHRRVGDAKWYSRAGTHPNHLPLMRLRNESEVLYIIEGHHDMLTAILLGIDFIMLPTASFKLSHYPQLVQMVRERDVLFLVEDERAHRCMSALAVAFAEHATSIRLRLMGDGVSKLDLSDYVETCKSIKEVKDGLQN